MEHVKAPNAACDTAGPIERGQVPEVALPIYHERTSTAMHARRLVAFGTLVGGLLLGLSCSGPSANQSGPSDTESPARIYHVQVDMSKEKDAAHQTLGAVLSWWETHAASFESRLFEQQGAAGRVAHIKWKAPYYRVRLGPFASRSEAREVLQDARSAFPDAFLVPERRSAQESSP